VQVAAAPTLALPGADVFRVPEALGLTLLAARSPRSQRSARPAPGAAAPRSQALTARQVKHPRQAAHQAPAAATHGKRRALPLHAAEQPEAASTLVRVANVKKRTPRAVASANAKRVAD
jgi:hypothetical protein